MGSGLHFLQGINEAEPDLGSNGSGKTSIFDALCFVLFGKTVDNLRGDDIRTWEATDINTRLTLFFYVDDKRWTIVRDVTNHSLLLNGGIISQEELERKTGLSYTLFINAIVIQGDDLFVDRTPREKMDVLSDALDLERWEVRSQRAAGDVAEIKEESNIQVGAISVLAVSIQNTKESIDSLNTTFLVHNKQVEADRLVASKRLAQLQKRFDALDKLRNNWQLKGDWAWTEANAEERLSRKLEVQLDHLEEKIQKSHTQVLLAEEGIGRLEKELLSLGKTDKCPTCGQSVKGTGLATHKEELKKSIRVANALHERHSNTETGLLVRKEKLSNDFARAFKSYSKFKGQAEKHEDQINDSNLEYVEVKTKLEIIKEDMAKEPVNPYEQPLLNARKQYNDMVSDLNAAKLKLSKLDQDLNATEYWVKGFKDVKLFIVEDVLQELEMQSNILLGEFGLAGWVIRYDVEKETKSGTVQRGIHASVLPPGRSKPIKFNCYSGGERQRLRLISSLALAEVLLSYVNVDPSLMALDEPTQHLSAEGVADLCDILRVRAKQIDRTILLADHMAQPSSMFSSTMTVVKDKQGSYIDA
jgi:DNA repair exonuclease SbcCD ATPase subunit